MLSYHDVEIEFEGQPRIAFSSGPFSWELTCTRAGGWQLWDHYPECRTQNRNIAAEYGGDGVPRLSIWVDGVQVLDRNAVRKSV